jgi:hypothetical protein
VSHSRSAKKGSGCGAERIGGSVPKAGKVAGTSCGSGSMGSADREASRRNWAATKRSKAGRIGESANLSAPQPQSWNESYHTVAPIGHWILRQVKIKTWQVGQWLIELVKLCVGPERHGHWLIEQVGRT